MLDIWFSTFTSAKKTLIKHKYCRLDSWTDIYICTWSVRVKIWRNLWLLKLEEFPIKICWINLQMNYLHTNFTLTRNLNGIYTFSNSRVWLFQACVLQGGVVNNHFSLCCPATICFTGNLSFRKLTSTVVAASLCVWSFAKNQHFIILNYITTNTTSFLEKSRLNYIIVYQEH